MDDLKAAQHLAETGAALTAYQVAKGAGIKLGSLAGIGVVGALLIAAVDPTEVEPDPRKRKRLIVAQVLTAGVMSTVFTLPVVRWLDYVSDWINLGRGASIEDWFEIAMPVGLLIGALSWGIVGALVKLRKLIRERGADEIARRVAP